MTNPFHVPLWAQPDDTKFTPREPITFTGDLIDLGGGGEMYGDDHPLRGHRDPIGQHRLKGCDNPACPRAVPEGVHYCCGGCDRSHQMKSEPGDLSHDPPMFSHGEDCTERWRQRREKLRRFIPIWMEADL